MEVIYNKEYSYNDKQGQPLYDMEASVVKCEKGFIGLKVIKDYINLELYVREDFFFKYEEVIEWLENNKNLICDD